MVVVFYVKYSLLSVFFFFQAEDGIRDFHVTGVQTCALPIYRSPSPDNRVPATDRQAMPSRHRRSQSSEYGCRPAEDRSWEKHFHDPIVDVRPERFDFFVLARRVNAIGQQHDMAILFQIPPDRAPREAQVPDRARRKKTATGGHPGRRRIPSEREGGILERWISGKKLLHHRLRQKVSFALESLAHAH